MTEGTGRTAGQRYLVSRHPGARDWLLAQGLKFDRHVAHLIADQVQADDVVVGTLPMHLAADVCARGARVVLISLDLPRTLRGQELDRHQLEHCNPRLEEFRVARIATFPPLPVAR